MKVFIYNFLRKTQKYTGTDNIYLTKGGFWLVSGQVIAALAAFLLAVAFANFLDPTTYGNYKYILSLFGILSIFTMTGMRTAIKQAVARGLEGSFYTGFKTRLKWGSLASLTAILWASYYWWQGDKILPIPLLISAVFLPLMYASRVYTSFFGGRKLFNIVVKYNMLSQIIPAIAIFVVLLLTKNLFWLATTYIVSNTLANYFFYLLTKIKFRPNKKEDEKTLNYGKHLSFMSVISIIDKYLDKILLFNLASAGQLAIYSFAILIPEEIRNIGANISTLAFPKLAPKSREEIRTNIMKKFWKLFLLVGTIIALYIVLAPYLYKIIFSQYLGSVLYSQVFIISLVSLPASLLSTVFKAKMMKKELYILKISPVIRIILFITLIPIFGIWGLVIAKVGVAFFNLGLILFLFRKF